jgi:hypothetical protein
VWRGWATRDLIRRSRACFCRLESHSSGFLSLAGKDRIHPHCSDVPILLAMLSTTSIWVEQCLTSEQLPCTPPSLGATDGSLSALYTSPNVSMQHMNCSIPSNTLPYPLQIRWTSSTTVTGPIASIQRCRPLESNHSLAARDERVESTSNRASCGP